MEEERRIQSSGGEADGFSRDEASNKAFWTNQRVSRNAGDQSQGRRGKKAWKFSANHSRDDETKMAQSGGRFPSKEEKFSYRDFKCYRCLEFGHIGRNCPYKEDDEEGSDEEKMKAIKPLALLAFRNDSKKTNAVFRRKNVNGGKDDPRHKELRCFRCLEFGHIGRNCQHGATANSEEIKPTPIVNIAAPLALYATQVKDKTASSVWVMDSGCTDHMSSYKDKFVSFTPVKIPIEVAGGGILEASGKGNIQIKLSEENGGLPVILYDALFVPNLKGNFLSMMKVAEKGLLVSFDNKDVRISRDGDMLIKGCKDGRLYYVYEDDVTERKPSVENGSFVNKAREVGLWHRRLGHPAVKALMKKEDPVTSDFDRDDQRRDDCSTCLEEKLKTKPCPKKSFSREKEPLRLIHTDVGGPVRPTSKAKTKKRSLEETMTMWCPLLIDGEEPERDDIEQPEGENVEQPEREDVEPQDEPEEDDAFDNEGLLDQEGRVSQEVTTRSGRRIVPPVWTKYYLIENDDHQCNQACMFDERTNDPQTPEEALSRKDAVKWKDAMIEEFRNHISNKTFEMVVRRADEAMKLAENPNTSDRSKHIDLNVFYVRDLIEEGKIQLKYVKSENNLADQLTKVILSPKLHQHHRILGIVDPGGVSVVKSTQRPLVQR